VLAIEIWLVLYASQIRVHKMSRTTSFIKLPPKESSELVIGLIGPVGTDMELVSSLLETNLKLVDYQAIRIHLINGLKQIECWSKLPDSPLDVRYGKHMDAGDEFREKIKRGDALALLGVSTIVKERLKIVQKDKTPSPRTAYILRSLKTPEEVDTLRGIYGDSFILIAAFSNKDQRKQKLADRIAASHHSMKPEDYFPVAEDLIKRDEAEIEREFGQNIRDAFHRADSFVHTHKNIEGSIKRIVELTFGNTFHTPTRDEYGMFHAWGASLRSSALGRQVGAAITSEDGEIIAVGCNEVPKAHGGLYWPGDPEDERDHCLRTDSNDDIKYAVFADVLKRLKEADWLSAEQKKKEVPELLEKALADRSNMGLGRAELLSITEYGRAVHAEMAALMDAARRGVNVSQCNLYTTTFPCHNCTKHIIAAGIKRIVYIEPYPKSYAYRLHKDSIEVDAAKQSAKRVQFEAFVGISPRLYFDLFSMGDIARKKGGKVNEWTPSNSTPRLSESPLAYLFREDHCMLEFKKLLKQEMLEPVGELKKGN
jgi:deoxycytidylate deaminase